MNEELDGSALRELLEPAVAGRGAAGPPTDAIVASGRRRVRGRRITVAGGAVALVAAVPLAASAIAAGPGGDSGSSAATGVPGAMSGTHSAPAPPSSVRTSTAPTAPSTAVSTTASPKKQTWPVGPLPTTPQLLAEGTLDGKKWTVSGVASGGNNDLTKDSKCLKLLITDGGKTEGGPSDGPLFYCSGYRPDTYLFSELKYDIPGGSGNLAIGTAASKVAKIVVHIQGVAAPLTVETVPAPGVDRSIYVIPTDSDGLMDFDLYDTAGQLIGHANDYSNPPNLPSNQTENGELARAR